MNTKLFIFIALVTVMPIIGCSQKKTQAQAKQKTVKEEKPLGLSARNRGILPDSLSLPADSLQANIARQKQELLKKKAKHIQEAMDAVEGTQDALAALQHGEKDKAMAVLTQVDGKIDLLLARYPEDKLIPIDASVDDFNLVSNLDAVKKARKEAKKLLDKGYVQDARHIIDQLVSEIRVTTVYLPMDTYPDAIKEVAKLLNQGKENEALRVLQTALSTLVVDEQAVPVPIINAEAMIETASQVADTAKVQAQGLLRDARGQLAMAKELGYGKRDGEYKKMEKEIKSVSEKLANGEKTGDLFHRLLNHVRALKKKI
ncbi:MAG: YfdX family protein [Calditrichaeota bacterium]|nr:YfdX family protein [Calditrichota bacterium]